MGIKKNNNTKFPKLFLKFTTNYLIEDSNSNLETLKNRIQFYRELIKNLEDEKPLFFQKKKLIDYNNKLEEYNNKINDLYIEFYEEITLLEKLYEQI